jgi:hypothetical protein
MQQNLFDPPAIHSSPQGSFSEPFLPDSILKHAPAEAPKARSEPAAAFVEWLKVAPANRQTRARGRSLLKASITLQPS